MAHASSDAGAGDQDCQGRGLVCFAHPRLGFGLIFAITADTRHMNRLYPIAAVVMLVALLMAACGRNDKQREGYIQVIRNRLKTGNHWVGVHLEGQPIGAVVSVVQGEKRQFLPILTGDSLDAQHATTAHFGLGKTDSIDALQVRWPDGNITRLEKPAVDSYYVIRP